MISPNFKIKVAKSNLELANFVGRTSVILPLGIIYTSPLHLAAHFKRNYLKSYRDVEDAVHIEEILKIKKDRGNARNKMKRLVSSPDRVKDRLNFVKYWAEYVRTHSDKEWSRQQNILINSIMQNAKNSKLTPKQYLKIKGEKCFR